MYVMYPTLLKKSSKLLDECRYTVPTFQGRHFLFAVRAHADHSQRQRFFPARLRTPIQAEPIQVQKEISRKQLNLATVITIVELIYLLLERRCAVFQPSIRDVFRVRGATARDGDAHGADGLLLPWGACR